jgi:thiamine pyrophosphate-dependent acetolactate synthase large subunit-like protein
MRQDAIVVNGTGGMGIEVNTKSPSDLNLYAAMPYPMPLGLGLALALPKQRVVVTEGDGSALSGLSGLATVANMAPANFIHVVWDNGAWMSPGTMGTRNHYGPLPTATGGRTDLEGFAKATGYAHTTTIATLNEFEAALRAALEKQGPSYIAAKIDRKLMPDLAAKPLGTVSQEAPGRKRHPDEAALCHPACACVNTEANLEINPGSGEDLACNVKELLRLDPALVTRLKEILK